MSSDVENIHTGFFQCNAALIHGNAALIHAFRILKAHIVSRNDEK